MSNRWQDNIPVGAPKPKPGERRGPYLLRMLREDEAKRLQELSEATSKRVDPPPVEE